MDHDTDTLLVALRRRRALVCLLAIGLAAAWAASPALAKRKKIKPTRIALVTYANSDESALHLLRLTLSLTPGAAVSMERPGSDRSPVRPEVFQLAVPAVEPSAAPLAGTVAAARKSLESLPRWWRKPSLGVLASLRLESIDGAAGIRFLDGLKARGAGDPERAAAAFAEAAGGAAAPIASYLRGAALLEGGMVSEAALALAPVATDREALPPALRGVALAATAAAAFDFDQALSRLDGVLHGAPRLAEARWLRAWISSSACGRYDRERILADLQASIEASPCCPACALDLSEAEAFTGLAEEAARKLRPATCDPAALDAMNQRARALAFQAAGFGDEARSAREETDSRDVSALRSGLAPSYMLAGDFGRLAASYDSEGDARLAPPVSAEQHLHAGLVDLWMGRPSSAALQLERAEEHLRSMKLPGGDRAGLVQLAQVLRIRAYLTAGRTQEAARAAKEALEGAEPARGLLLYTAALADIAAGNSSEALSTTRLMISDPEEKVWRYLVQAQVALAEGRAREAWEQARLALAGVNTQVSVCPGISAEPYLLEPQARALLALGRPGDAIKILDRIGDLGARGIWAPDIIVPSAILTGKAREEMGDAKGAAQAYAQIAGRWGGGEEVPASAEARRLAAALSSKP